MAELSLNLKKSWFLIIGKGLTAISNLKAKNTQVSDCRIVGFVGNEVGVFKHSIFSDSMLSFKAWTLIFPISLGRWIFFLSIAYVELRLIEAVTCSVLLTRQVSLLCMFATKFQFMIVFQPNCFLSIYLIILLVSSP